MLSCYLGTLILCVLPAILPLVMSFLGGGDGLVSAAGASAGGLGARLGLPWLSRAGRSHRSDVDSDDAGGGVGVGEADDREVMLPPDE